MFSKKDNSGASPSSPANALRRGRSAPSIVSDDLIVRGNLIATGDIQIDGTVEGDVRSQSLTVGEHATITGAIIAEEVVVRGRVVGAIRAHRVQLAVTCHVEGDILHESLAVETGAFFEGNCRHSDDPLSEDTQDDAEPTAPASLKIAEAQNPNAKISPVAAVKTPAAATTASDTGSSVVVKDGAVVVKRPAAR